MVLLSVVAAFALAGCGHVLATFAHAGPPRFCAYRGAMTLAYLRELHPAWSRVQLWEAVHQCV